MKLLDDKKRAYLGYFLSIIRVDLYNKILLRTILDSDFNYNFENISLENNLKAELQKKSKKHYFYLYFESRLNFYNNFFTPVNYTIEEVIDLLYEYRNFLLDDASRIDESKFPLILNKSIETKEKEIKTIILLLLSENLLEDYAQYAKENITDYQKYFYCQNKEVVMYRKYVNKYFGLSNYNNKIIYLERQLSGFKVSYPKKYSLIIYLFNNLPFLDDQTRTKFANLDMLLTKDYLNANYGLISLNFKDHTVLLNFNQLFILYFLLKNKEEDFLEIFFDYVLKRKRNNKLNKDNKKIVVKTNDIYNFDRAYFSKLLLLKINKQIVYKYFNFKTKKLIKPLTSPLILRMFLNFEFYKKHLKINTYRFPTFKLEESLLSLEFIDYKLVKKNLNYSIKLYLKHELTDSKKLKDGLYAILNQIKFTMNISDFNKIELIDEKIIYELQKDYKSNKKTIIKSYIDTMYVLLILRVHKYYRTTKYENVYIYRNKIMHFQKDLIHKELDTVSILNEINRLKLRHWNANINIKFSSKFFYLLEFDIIKMEKRKYEEKFT